MTTHPTRAGHHSAAAQHLVADGLHDRVGLAGEQRLVDLEVVADEHLAVGDHLRAGAQLDDVVEHEFVHLHFVHRAVAHDVGPGRVDDAELVEHLLGAQLLDDADHAVGDDHATEQRVLR